MYRITLADYVTDLFLWSRRLRPILTGILHLETLYLKEKTRIETHILSSEWAIRYSLAISRSLRLKAYEIIIIIIIIIMVITRTSQRSIPTGLCRMRDN